ncbi:hypothetical protein F0L68_23715 [Solihabitans fulvus]|uniref:Uncharacterized protein n=1 Tax=Solihabitans fulvus TaxID=1892852 RepID=A0A5B2X6V4_9PSEU|nr:hypothetical protein [Solihabitans fulvus]KAA2258829.1 hypothetical protein F0L68_23715 [Solihabitans fulvus]
MPHTNTKDDVLTKPAAVAWPGTASATVDLSATTAGSRPPAHAPAGTLPVTIARGHETATDTITTQHGSGQVKVETVDHALADRAGIRGTLLQVTPTAGDTEGPISLSLDYSAFAAAYGADFGQRLHLVQYPVCVLSTPDKPECRQATPVESSNTPKTKHVTGQVTLPRSTNSMTTHPSAAGASSSAVVAAVSGSNGGGGDFTATSLAPTGSWTSGGSSGDFGYSYPITLPAAPGGKAPGVSLGYSSGSVDGLTSATNNQPLLGR